MLRANPRNLCKAFFYMFLRSMVNCYLMFLRSMFILGVFCLRAMFVLIVNPC